MNLIPSRCLRWGSASLLAALSGAAQAQAEAPQPDHTLSFNAAAVTDYRYRGISQTRLKPAIQAGADFSHRSGFYAGAWASSIRWIADAGGDADAELDLYGGYKTSLGGLGLDVGVLRYLYPGSSLAVNPDTTEIYAAGTWGPATLKYSHALTNLFGFADSRNSYYVDLSATFGTGVWGLMVTPHIGTTRSRTSTTRSRWRRSSGLDCRPR
jgi:uncharacterized protein (TIGR02001 family)